MAYSYNGMPLSNKTSTEAQNVYISKALMPSEKSQTKEDILHDSVYKEVYKMQINLL